MQPRRQADKRGRRCTREAELIVVTAGKQALEREPALGAGETTIQRVRARDPRELDGRAHPGSLEDMAEITHQSIRNIDDRRGEPTQPLAERDARTRSQ